MNCCICSCEFEGYGNNPAGAVLKNEKGEVILMEFKADERCCDFCNNMFVIPGRLYRMTHKKLG